MTLGLRRAVVVRNAAARKNMSVERLSLVNADGTDALATPLVTTATAIGTAAKTTASAEPPANTFVAVKFTNGNSAASPTVAFAGGSARAVQLGGSAPLATELAVSANGVALFWFDGTILHQVGAYT